MEKRLTRKVSLDSHHHGCMFNIFSLFAFRHRHHFRRLLSDREQREQLVSGSTRSNQTQNCIHLCTESDINFNDEGKVKTNRRKRRKMFSKARIKAFIVREMMKNRVSPQRTPPASSRLQRLYSIHHMGSEDSETSGDEQLNSSDKSSCYTTSSSSGSHGEPTLLPVLSKELPNCSTEYEGRVPLAAKSLMGEGKFEGVGRQLLERQALLQEILNEVRESLSKQQSDNNEIPREGWQSTKIFDALEVLNTNRELFLKILKDVGHPPSGHFQGSSRENPLLTKSGTYPGTRSSGNIFSSIKLGRRSNNVFSLGSDYEITASDQSISCTSSELKMNPFKNIKRKIKKLLKQNEKEHLRVSLDAVLHKVPYGPNSPDGQILATQRDKQDSAISSISYGSEGPRSGQIKRSASLNESIDRYSQLFESISQKDSVMKRSRTLRVADSVSENKSNLERRISRRTYGRNHSLPNIPLYYFDHGIEDATSLDVHNSSSKQVDAIASVKSLVQHLRTQDFLSMTIAEEEEKPEETLSVSSAKANEDSSLVESMTFLQHQESTCSDNNLDHSAAMEPEINNDIEATSTMEPSEDLNELSCHDQEDVPFAEQSCVTEDTEMKLENDHFGEAKATKESPNQLINNELQSSNSQANIEEEQRYNDSGNYPTPPNFHVNTRDEADFFYVRNMLQKSGFNEKKLLETCHSPDEIILDPTLFDEVERSLSKLGTHEHEMGSAFAGSSLDHLLLFDLINEVLFEIYDRNFSSSSSCGLFSSQMSRPLPIGYHVLEEVWGRISWHLDFRPQIDTSLEQVKARDFAKCDGWMNVQMDTECLGLDLEEWVLDDMLDELVVDFVLA